MPCLASWWCLADLQRLIRAEWHTECEKWSECTRKGSAQHGHRTVLWGWVTQQHVQEEKQRIMSWRMAYGTLFFFFFLSFPSNCKQLSVCDDKDTPFILLEGCFIPLSKWSVRRLFNQGYFLCSFSKVTGGCLVYACMGETAFAEVTLVQGKSTDLYHFYEWDQVRNAKSYSRWALASVVGYRNRNWVWSIAQSCRECTCLCSRWKSAFFLHFWGVFFFFGHHPCWQSFLWSIFQTAPFQIHATVDFFQARGEQ